MPNLLITIKNFVTGGEGVKGLTDNLADLKAGIDIAKEAAGKAAEVFQKAWDLSQEGAQLNDLTASFDRMNQQIFKTPGLLEDMRAATRGTVADADLMKGILTLSAGASNDAAKAYAEAAPRLLEIAKASNKLNPALGDTAFLFDSLALGIKRGSPMILDNLGLQIKLGEANEKYAMQLGKSVEQLTAEEKTMALLNATMAAGDQMITQVGGSVDAQADSWAQLEVHATNAGNAFKQWFADRNIGTVAGMANTIDALSESSDKGRSKLLNLVIVKREIDKTFGFNTDGIDAYIASQKDLAAETQENITAAESYDRALMNSASAINSVNDAQQSQISYGNALSNQYYQQAQALQELNDAGVKAYAEIAAHQERVNAAFTKSEGPIVDLMAAQDALAENSGEWVQVHQSAADRVAKVNAELAADLTSEQKSAYSDILNTVEEGSAEWLSAYNALQGDLTDSQRSALVAQRAEIEAAGDATFSMYTGNIEAAEEAQAAIAAAEEAIRDEYRKTAAEAILARDGVNESTLSLLTSIGYMTEEEATARLEFAETTAAIEELTASHEFAKLSVEEQADALNALIDGQALTAEAALATAEAMSIEKQGAGELHDKLQQINGTFTATVNADTSAAEAAVARLKGLLNDIAGGGVAGQVATHNLKDELDGGRAIGGPVAAGGMYQVGEGNKPELYADDSGIYMIPGDQGQVFSNSDSNAMMGGISVGNINITIPGSNLTGRHAARKIATAVVDELGSLG